MTTQPHGEQEPSPARRLGSTLAAIKTETARSYDALGRRAGVSASALQRYCTGIGTPTEFDPLHRFARACGADGDTRRELYRLWVLADASRSRARTPTRAEIPGPNGWVPAQLPPGVTPFVGRAAALAELDTLSAGSPVVAVTGMPGSGKTALVVRWAHRARDRFRDGQLYADLRGFAPDPPVPVCEVLAGFLAALGVAGADLPAGVDQLAARYRTELSGRRVLVVLDNVAAADDVRPLLPGPSCHTVVTSRDRLAGLVVRDGARRLDLDVPPVNEAVDLLRCLLGDQVDADPVAAAAMATRCGRSPLVLRLAAELATARPGIRLREILDGLIDPLRLLDALSAGGDPRTGLGAVLSWSYRQLAAGEALTFRALGLHPGPEVGFRTAAALTGGDPPAVRSVLARLAGASLLRATGPGRYALPEPLRTYARHLTHVAETRAGVVAPGTTSCR